MATPLKRCLSLWEIVVYGVGLILGAGIYVLIGPAAAIAGHMLWLSFILSALVAGFTAASYAELSTIFPKSGAEFVFVKNAFNSDLLGWVVGFCAIIIGITSASTVAIGFAKYFGYFLNANSLMVATILIVVMAGLNFWGIEQSARFNLVATIIEVSGLLLVILFGFYYLIIGDIPTPNYLAWPTGQGDYISRLFPVITASALIFFAYIGFEDIANIAEEAEHPRKALPKAYFYSLLISTVLYVMISLIVVAVVSPVTLGKLDQPLSEVMKILVGGFSPKLLSIIALFATANTVLITLIVSARMLYGMASEKSIAQVFSRVHKKRQTPWVAIGITGLLSILFLGFKKIEILASLADVGIFVLFFAVNVSNIVLRYKQPERERPWRTPFNLGSFPLLSGLGAISCLALLVSINHPVEVFNVTISSLIIGLLILGLSIPMYFIVKRRIGRSQT